MLLLDDLGSFLKIIRHLQSYFFIFYENQEYAGDRWLEISGLEPEFDFTSGCDPVNAIL